MYDNNKLILLSYFLIYIEAGNYQTKKSKRKLIIFYSRIFVKNLQMADLRSLVLIQAAAGGAAAETSDRT